jgi:hypothetical protein
MNTRKSWQEKLADSKDLPKVCVVSEKQSIRWGKGTFVIPAPCEVDQLMKQVPKGKLTTINELRTALAQKHKTNIACPITTGIFAWIAAHAAAEARDEGKKKFTAYWRTLKSGGELNEKYPGGIAALVKLLESEGHSVVQKGKKYIVTDFQRAIFMPQPEESPRSRSSAMA